MDSVRSDPAPMSHACPFPSTDRVGDSPGQTLPLGRWAVTFMQLLFQKEKQLVGGLTCSPGLGRETGALQTLPGTPHSAEACLGLPGPSACCCLKHHHPGRS